MLKRSPLIDFGNQKRAGVTMLNNNCESGSWHPEKGHTTKRNVYLDQLRIFMRARKSAQIKQLLGFLSF